MVDSISLADYERAESELRVLDGHIGVSVHAAIYVLVNAMFLAVNLVFVPGFMWFLFPLVVWGIGLTMHYLFAVRFGRKAADIWQARVEHRALELQRRRVSAR